MQWFEYVGLAGFALQLGGFAYLQYRRDFARTFTYSVLNLSAAILISVTYFYQWNTASFVGNTAWGIISIYGVYRCAKYHMRERKAKSAS